MCDFKLIVSDLDGTLLKSDMTMSENNYRAIEKFNQMGINFVASSGRTFFEIPDFIRENPNIRFVIYSNGTAIYDKEKGCDVVSNRIPKRAAREALDIIADYDVIYAIHSGGYSNMDKNQFYNCDLNYFQINDYYKILLADSVMVDGIEKFGRENDVEAIVLFFHSDKELEQCRVRLQKVDGVTVTSSIGHNLELCSSYAGKGTALSQLAKILDIPKEKIISVGDNMNDTSMFAFSGLSLCTSNGNDMAKSLADKVICSNDDGIADYILNNFIN